jgi:hypothetical protein
VSRLQRSLVTAALAAGAIGLGVAVLLTAPSSQQAEEEELTARRRFTFGTAHVRRARLVTGEGTMAFERDPATEWRITRPFRWPGATEPIAALLGRVSALRSERTVFETPTEDQLKRAGLDRPRVDLVVELTDGTHRRLQLGAINQLSDLVYARSASGPSAAPPMAGPVFLTTPASLWAMDRPFEEFRTPRVLPLDRDHVRRLEKRSPSGLEWVVRAAQPYEVSADGQRFRPADPGRVAVAMAATFLRLEADHFLVDGARDLAEALARLPGSEGRLAYALTATLDSGGVHSATVAVVKRPDAPEATPMAFVDGALMELYSPPAEELAKLQAEDLVDRTITAVEPARVHRLTVVHGDAGQPWVFERRPEGWAQTEPRSSPADPRTVGRVVRVLSALRGDRTVTYQPTPAQLDQWMLQPPSRRYRLESREGESLAVVTLGSYASPTELHVMGTGPRVDAISVERVREIPSQLTEYQAR